MEDQIYLLLGSNLGDPVNNLESACERINRHIGTIMRRSSYYKTAPWGITNQPVFYNLVIQIASPSPSTKLLHDIQRIEIEMGRVREIKWGPRVIDIDILFYGNHTIDSTELIIPHPGIPDRRFTLTPLAELSPGFIHPILKKSIQTLLEECEDSSDVERILL